MACTPKTKCYILFGFGVGLIALAIALILSWPTIYNNILTSQLSLSQGSKSYELWKETPIPMYLDIYLFNLTNSQEIVKDWNVKPIYEELGPYVFLEKHTRVDVAWNKDDTVTFRQIRNWKFQPDLSKGSLEDNITNLNVIAATVANMVRFKYILIVRAVDLIMREEKETLFVTHTAKELLFEGYDDKLLKLVANISIPGFNIPFSKFGWFFGREGDKNYDGLFNMYTGKGDFDKLGMMKLWNGKPKTPYYPDHCGAVDGTTGELWPPVGENKTAKLFSSDICSAMTMDLDSNIEVKGIEGVKFIGTAKTFDNGSRYPENSCFNIGEGTLSGVRNVSGCRFGAPAYLSFPHFYLADDSYREAVEGMKPNESMHQLHLELEPNTGIPLGIEAKIQINIRVQHVKGIRMFDKAKTIFMPMFWFNQRASLTDDLASQLKLLLVLPNLGNYTSYGMAGIGCLLLIIGLYVIYHINWKDNEGELLISDAQFRPIT